MPARDDRIAFFEHYAVEHAVVYARRAGKAEPSGRLAVEYQHHEGIEVELVIVALHMQRYAVQMQQVLYAREDVGQLADLVFEPIGRMLRGCGKDAEAEYVDEVEPVDHAAVDTPHLSRNDLAGSAHYVAVHAQRTGEVVGRACGYDRYDGRERLALHRVDDIVYSAVASAYDGKMAILVAVEGVLPELYEFGADVVSRLAEYLSQSVDVAGYLAPAGLDVIE